MDKLLITGIDSVIGANLATQSADRYHVIGVSGTVSVSIEDCESIHLPSEDARSIRDVITQHQPERIVICGVAGDSPWHVAPIAETGAIAAARTWARAAQDCRIPITLIASDAIFTGPWMFHAETSGSFCRSAAAQSLQVLESSILAECSDALIVRTHAYGWSPLSDRLGWIEGIIAALESDRPSLFDCFAHGTPILATDLADILHRAWSAGLAGTYHVAGAERTNPHRFAHTLAKLFDLAPPRAALLTPPDSAPAGMAQGETSLHTGAIRRTLGVAMPLLAEGLTRLREQRNNGFDRRFQGNRRFVPSKVA